jgi:hypothetical protein
MRRVRFPLIALAVFAASVSVSPGPLGAQGEPPPACNNKACEGVGEHAHCKLTANGPTVNCSGSGLNCSWGPCNDE